MYCRFILWAFEPGIKLAYLMDDVWQSINIQHFKKCLPNTLKGNTLNLSKQVKGHSYMGIYLPCLEGLLPYYCSHAFNGTSQDEVTHKSTINSRYTQLYPLLWPYSQHTTSILYWNITLWGNWLHKWPFQWCLSSPVG